MAQLRQVGPDRLEIREGGGCLSLFGWPFFAAGLFMVLTTLGLIPSSTAGELPRFAWPVLGLMGVVFTAVGGTLVFGRSWVVVDATRRMVVKQWGFLVPMRERSFALDGFTAVTLGFMQGDSDTADRFPIGLRAATGADLGLSGFTSYAESWACAAAIAHHLRLDVEDATTDHPVRVSFTEVTAARLADDRELPHHVPRPSGARSQVLPEAGQVQIVIPQPRIRALTFAVTLIPIAISLVMAPSFLTFFRRTETPGAVGWTFLAFFLFLFGVLPLTTVVNALLKSRYGRTIVTVSPHGVRIQERGAWRTRTIASLDAADIVDVDFSTRDSAVAAMTRAAEQKVLESGQSMPAANGPLTDRLLARIVRSVKNRGLTVKTRQGLTTFGDGLDDEEVRYLHFVVRRALRAGVED